MRYGMFIDLNRCVGCYSCVAGCKNWNTLNHAEGTPIKILNFTTGSYPEITRWMVPIFCGQCEKAPCVEACNTKALYRNEKGIIMVDQDRCVGRRKCEKACPFGVIVFDTKKQKIFKCDFCYDRINNGLIPFCAYTCPTEAIWFDEVNKILKEKGPCLCVGEEFGSCVFYPMDEDLEADSLKVLGIRFTVLS